MALDDADLHGLRVLVVEDSLLVAEVIVETLQTYGCNIVGPAARVQRGMALAREEALDGAVLDVNLAGEFCYPIAAALQARGVPFIFLTGYGEAESLPPQFRTTPMLGKPFDGDNLAALVSQRFRRAV